MEIPRSKFVVSESPRRSKRPYVVVGIAVIVTAAISSGRQHALVAGASGDTYQVPQQKKVWRAVGPALSVRFYTDHSNKSGAAAEAADLLPRFAAKADSAGLHYLVLRAYNPIWQLGDIGLYRGWNFRYERTERGWEPSGYW